MILATVTGLSAWVLVGVFAALCGWALWAARSYRHICEQDAEQIRQRESVEVIPAFDFKLARRPVASTKSPRVVRATEGVTHGGPRE